MSGNNMILSQAKDVGGSSVLYFLPNEISDFSCLHLRISPLLWCIFDCGVNAQSSIYRVDIFSHTEYVYFLSLVSSLFPWYWT